MACVPPPAAQTGCGTLPETPAAPALADHVRSALHKTGHGWLRRVDVTATTGVVLQGKVPSFYLKQLAQITVMAVSGVELVRNELEVEGGNR